MKIEKSQIRMLDFLVRQVLLSAEAAAEQAGQTGDGFHEVMNQNFPEAGDSMIGMRRTEGSEHRLGCRQTFHR